MIDYGHVTFRDWLACFLAQWPGMRHRHGRHTSKRRGVVVADPPRYRPVTYHVLTSYEEKGYHTVLAADYHGTSTTPALCGSVQSVEPFGGLRTDFSRCDTCWVLLPENAICIDVPRSPRIDPPRSRASERVR